MKKYTKILIFTFTFFTINALFLSRGYTSEMRSELIGAWDVECKYSSGGDLTTVTCHIDGQYDCNCPKRIFDVE